MHKLFFFLFFIVAVSISAQIVEPDLTKKEDLKNLGIGRIIEKDNSIYKKIELLEVKDYWIIYEKSESTHDMMMENINRLEFPNSKWGMLIITFPNNKAEITWLRY